jgi:hypothetical protein
LHGLDATTGRLTATLAAAAALALPGCSEDRPRVTASEPAVVWAVGDGADGSDEAEALARQIERDRPDGLLYLGDVYPTGTAKDFATNWREVYGRLDEIVWPTAGNHEWGNRHVGYYPYWRRRGRARPWYRLDFGGWELLALNSEAPHAAGSRQLRWLRDRLAGARGTCRLAFWHRPRFSAGPHGDSDDVRPLWDALRGKARLVLSGHDHVMLRFRRHQGITQYVAGTGGDTLYEVEPDRRVAFGREGATGALRVRLSPGEARLEFRALGGRVLDRSRVGCDPG